MPAAFSGSAFLDGDVRNTGANVNIRETLTLVESQKLSDTRLSFNSLFDIVLTHNIKVSSGSRQGESH